MYTKFLYVYNAYVSFLYKLCSYEGNSEVVAQPVRASTPDVCRAECHGFELQPLYIRLASSVTTGRGTLIGKKIVELVISKRYTSTSILYSYYKN